MMRFSNTLFPSLLLALIIPISEAATDPLLQLPNPGIKSTATRTILCPEKLDVTGVETKDELYEYLKKAALSELPYEKMKHMIGVHSKINPQGMRGSLESTGGLFALKKDSNSVSKMLCEYIDGSGTTHEFAFQFRSELTFHVTGRLPAYPGEPVFEKTALKDGNQLTCTAVNKEADPSHPHCKLTPAFILVTNNIEFTRSSKRYQNTQHFGSLQFNSLFREKDSNEISYIPPGTTRAYPMYPVQENTALEVKVTAFREPVRVQDLCVSSWLPSQAFDVEYGASPHITISGLMSADGNTMDLPDEGFSCELRCNEKPDLKECWTVGIWDYLAYPFATTGKRPNLELLFLAGQLPALEDVDYLSLRKEILKTHIKRKEWVIKIGREFTIKDLKTPVARLEEEFHRQVLGVDATAGDKAIKKAYRELNRIYHPDKCEFSAEECKKHGDIQAAHAFLISSKKGKDEL